MNSGDILGQARRFRDYRAIGERAPIIFLDSHRNPIIYVPKGGMSGVTQGGKPITVATPGARNVTVGGTTVFQVSGFFAASGEDGNFQSGDDNVYSFQ